ncbi:FHA domain protein [Marinomonas spartinae]|uniref:FHA domain protein n=1 Tax=Marinomonas spartinae TaxID=1792290 RepID=A0A1A8TPY2_9GAMM|nr:FHA domain-containing protein [Marinomonas spartinae]SBS35433.1 FHA domain protein [Marinomonas spartinae]
MSHIDQIKSKPNLTSDLSSPETSPSRTNLPETGTLSSSSGENVYLRNYHTLGRADNCHTHLPASSVSRLHAIIFWQDNTWYIEDKSTNGVWVNEHKLQTGRPHALNKYDTIIFSSKDVGLFTLTNNTSPQDLLIPVDLNQPLTPICLDKPIHALSEVSTLLWREGSWVWVDNETLPNEKRVLDGDIIRVGKHEYRMQFNQMSSNTSQYLPVAQTLEDLTFQLNVSNDEEDIQLYIMDGVQTAEIKGYRIQSQLYLLLYLARQAVYDKQQGYAENQRGWVDLSKLSKDLGIETENTRIRLHRLRSRIRDVVSFSNLDVCQLLQLQNGEVRLNTSNILIYKGQQYESQNGIHRLL